MKIYEIERKIQLNQLWKRYLAVCKSKQHAINVMRKVTGKMWSADFMENDIGNLYEDLRWREDIANGLYEAEFEFEHGDWGDRQEGDLKMIEQNVPSELMDLNPCAHAGLFVSSVPVMGKFVPYDNFFCFCSSLLNDDITRAIKS